MNQDKCCRFFDIAQQPASSVSIAYL